MTFTPNQIRVASWAAIALVSWLLLSLLAPVLMPFLLAAVLAYALHPLVERLHARRIPRWLGAGLAITMLSLVMLAVVLLIVPVITKQVPLLKEQVPVLLAGNRASGVFRLNAQQRDGRWQFRAHFYPAFEHTLTPTGQARAAQLRAQLQQQRAGHAAWLDQPLASAPQALWRRDTRGGSWDNLLHQALAERSQRVLFTVAGLPMVLKGNAL